MKKTMFSFGIVFALMSLLLLPSSARSAQEIIENYKDRGVGQPPPTSSTPEMDQIGANVIDATQDYTMLFNDGVLIGRYDQTNEYYTSKDESKKYVAASTELKLSDAQFGYAKTVLQAINNELSIVSSPSHTYGRDCNNLLSSGTARVEKMVSCDNIVHYGWRATSSGDIVQYWNLVN